MQVCGVRQLLGFSGGNKQLQVGASQKVQGISVKSQESRHMSFNNPVAYYQDATAKCCN